MTRLRFRRKPAPEAVPAFDPFAPYDDPVMVRYAAEEERKAREAQEASEAPEPEEAQHYGRPGFWPGAQYPFVRESEPDAAEASPAARGRACRRGRRTGARKRTASPPPAAIEYRRRSADASPGRAGGIVAGQRRSRRGKRRRKRRGGVHAGRTGTRKRRRFPRFTRRPCRPA